jgi:alkaline phosphatase D
MSHQIDRRLLLKTATLGLGALALPGGAFAAMQAALTPGFSHGVASGEPSQRSVLLWTRFVSNASGSKLRAEIWAEGAPNKIIAGGEVIASPTRDHIAKITVKGLRPGKRYNYRFIAPDGTKSPIGRTKTLPEGDVPRYRMAVFSCSNMPFGYFNAYAHANATDDFDLVLHLGDYLYEYQRGYYPLAKDAVAERLIEPAGEMVTLADYRLRYASYRADPDLQKLHAMHPMIAMWDDHEFANDAYAAGAQNHQASEGDWGERKIAAERAYREWMPVSDRVGDVYWSKYAIGNLAEIQLTESRVSARSEQLSISDPQGDADEILRQLKAFHDGALQDSGRTMLGAVQDTWLAKRFAAPNKRWNIWAQQTIVGALVQPQGLENWLAPDAPSFVKERVMRGALAAKAGIPSNMDAWDGYPAARSKALSAAQAGNADLIVLTGDTHNAWAFDLAHDGKAAGVEFAGQSVTSPGLESSFTGADNATLSKALVTSNPGLLWADTTQRGYMAVELTSDKAVSEWRFTDSIKTRSPKLTGTKRMQTRHGVRKADPLGT